MKNKVLCMERNIYISWLLDFYGALLTEKQKTVLELHYNEDLSLGEIAQQEGISRQGVYDAAKRAEKALYELELQLGLLEKHIKTKLIFTDWMERLQKIEVQPSSTELIRVLIEDVENYLS